MLVTTRLIKFQVSGTRYLASFPLIQTYLESGLLGGPRGTNLLDGGAPFYDTYTCQDGGWMSVGCLEPQFFKEFIERFTKALPENFDPFSGWKPDLSTQFQMDEWPRLAQYLTKGFLTHPRAFWADLYYGACHSRSAFCTHLYRRFSCILLMTGTDACAVPVLTPREAAKQTSAIPVPHPRLSAQANLPEPVDSKNLIIKPGAHMREVLQEYGLDAADRMKLLHKEGVFGRNSPPRSKM